MNTIEQSIQIYFKQEKDTKVVNNLEKINIDVKEPILIPIYEEKSNQNKLKIPIAWIGSVAEGSPSEAAGLRQNDAIINFDNTVYYGVTNNPLQKISEIVGKKINTEIPVEILRQDEEGNNLCFNLKLVPHTWSGQGVLGCKFNLTDTKNA